MCADVIMSPPHLTATFFKQPISLLVSPASWRVNAYHLVSDLQSHCFLVVLIQTRGVGGGGEAAARLPAFCII